MGKSEKVEIIYHNGQPNGIRMIRRSLSTMTTFVIPRTLLSDAKKINNIQNPGIYYLIEEDENNKITKIYIGQTRNGVNRLVDHNLKKDFWTKAIMFLADSKTFTLDMINGLEKYAIEKAYSSKRYEVENKKPNCFEIDEYDLPSIEKVYDEIEFIMATQGYSFVNAKTESIDSELYHTTRNGISARGYYKGDTFVVLEGSEIDLTRKAIREKIENQRHTMLKDKQIELINGKYRLNISISFTSPGSAAVFVLGGSQNGWVEWKNENGITLSDAVRKD